MYVIVIVLNVTFSVKDSTFRNPRSYICAQAITYEKRHAEYQIDTLCTMYTKSYRQNSSTLLVYFYLQYSLTTSMCSESKKRVK